MRDITLPSSLTSSLEAPALGLYLDYPFVLEMTYTASLSITTPEGRAALGSLSPAACPVPGPMAMAWWALSEGVFGTNSKGLVMASLPCILGLTLHCIMERKSVSCPG